VQGLFALSSGLLQNAAGDVKIPYAAVAGNKPLIRQPLAETAIICFFSLFILFELQALNGSTRTPAQVLSFVMRAPVSSGSMQARESTVIAMPLEGIRILL
jgi:hypothetical protein